MLRGRAAGEVTALLKDGLLGAGYPSAGIHEVADEVDAARHLLRWAQRGDVLVLPIHQSASRIELAALLDQLEQSRWLAGMQLPPRLSPPLPPPLPTPLTQPCFDTPLSTAPTATAATAEQ